MHSIRCGLTETLILGVSAVIAPAVLAPHKITVNNIGPGAIDTPLDKPTKDDPQKFQTLLGEIPLARLGRPEEVAGLVVFLASEAAAYVTGSTYFMNGGMLRQSGSL